MKPLKNPFIIDKVDNGWNKKPKIMPSPKSAMASETHKKISAIRKAKGTYFARKNAMQYNGIGGKNINWLHKKTKGKKHVR